MFHPKNIALANGFVSQKQLFLFMTIKINLGANVL